MKFYSGFSLKNEEYFFDAYLDKGDYSVSGFSYGAISALQTVLASIDNNLRVDKLQLLSPAFFQTYDKKFKRLQLMSYRKDTELYLNNFIDLCFSPYAIKELQKTDTTVDELEELLDYKWSLQSLQKVVDSGVKIEIYLGGKDKIIDVQSAYDFFLEIGTITYIKDANHFLQIN